MKKPTWYLVRDNLHWDCQQVYMVEYLLYTYGAQRTTEMCKMLARHFNQRVNLPNTCKLLTQLTKTKRVRRIGRGLYEHASNPGIDIFS